MASFAKLYNSLPNLHDADQQFVDRDAIFDRLSDILSPYEGRYQVCLLHRHCTLDEGEIMLETGNVTEPVIVPNTDDINPRSWLPTGECFEYSNEATTTPPPALFDAFQIATVDINVLGLRYMAPRERVPQVEWTEGRRNITRPIYLSDHDTPTIEAVWELGTKEMGTKKRCIPQIICVRDREGHTGRKAQTHRNSGQ